MPRPRNHTAHVTASVEELLRAVTRLVSSIGEALTAGRAEQVAAVQAARAAGKSVRVSVRRIGPFNPWAGLSAAERARRSAKARRGIKASWARYTPAQRRARIAKMKAGHKGRKRAGKK